MFLYQQSSDILFENAIHKEMLSRLGGGFRRQLATFDNPAAAEN